MHYSYCPLIWTFMSRCLNNALNNIHERKQSKNYLSKNLQFLAIEICKFQNGLSLPIMNDIFFSRQIIYNLQKFWELSTSNKNTVNFGTKTISYRGPQLWNLIPDNIKSEPALELFKKKIRKWKCGPCTCRMCETYLQHIGFIS